MREKLNLKLHNLDHTATLGRILAEVIPVHGPNLLLLYGALGAGKTTLARYFVLQLPGAEDSEISSTSFTLCNVYPTQPPVLHFDLYRLEPGQSDENFEEALEETENGTAIMLVEWPERIKRSLLPENFITCALTTDENDRTALLESIGDNASQSLLLLTEKAQDAGLVIRP